MGRQAAMAAALCALLGIATVDANFGNTATVSPVTNVGTVSPVADTDTTSPAAETGVTPVPASATGTVSPVTDAGTVSPADAVTEAPIPPTSNAGAVTTVRINNIRACANTEEQLLSCKQMIELEAFQYDCPGSPDYEEECFVHECIQFSDCLEAVKSGRADWAVADPLMLYFLNDEVEGTAEAVAPIALEVRANAVERGTDVGSGQGSDYYSVAVIRADTCQANPQITLGDTRGMHSCHTRYGDIASWAFPVWALMSEDLAFGTTDVEVLQSFYPESCAAANGEHSICSACVHADDCDLTDPFAGDFGVIECLRTERGDIAFMDNFNAERADLDTATANDFRLLCSSGCEPIFDATRPGCTWGTVRADAAFIRVDNEYAAYIQWVVSNMADDNRFGFLFNGTTEGKFFSPSTTRMEMYSEDMDTYLGPLKEMLDVFKSISIQDSAADTAAAVADPEPQAVTTRTVRRGLPAWAVALLFFAALLVGLLVGMFVHKLRRNKSIDYFYKGDMDVVDGGLPNTDPRLDSSSPGDSPVHLGYPEVHSADLPVAPTMRSNVTYDSGGL